MEESLSDRADSGLTVWKHDKQVSVLGTWTYSGVNVIIITTLQTSSASEVFTDILSGAEKCWTRLCVQGQVTERTLDCLQFMKTDF